MLLGMSLIPAQGKYTVTLIPGDGQDIGHNRRVMH